MTASIVLYFPLEGPGHKLACTRRQRWVKGDTMRSKVRWTLPHAASTSGTRTRWVPAEVNYTSQQLNSWLFLWMTPGIIMDKGTVCVGGGGGRGYPPTSDFFCPIHFRWTLLQISITQVLTLAMTQQLLCFRSCPLYGPQNKALQHPKPCHNSKSKIIIDMTPVFTGLYGDGELLTIPKIGSIDRLRLTLAERRRRPTDILWWRVDYSATLIICTSLSGTSIIRTLQ